MSVNPVQPTVTGSSDLEAGQTQLQGKVVPASSTASTSDVQPDNPAVGDQVELSVSSGTQPSPALYVVAYHMDQQSNELYLQVVNEKTGEVIRQVPPADVRAFQARMSEYLKSRAESSQKPAKGGRGK